MILQLTVLANKSPHKRCSQHCCLALQGVSTDFTQNKAHQISEGISNKTSKPLKSGLSILFPPILCTNKQAGPRRTNRSPRQGTMQEHPHTNSVEPSSTRPSTNLLSLPPELLLFIFPFVGVKNFRQDVRRLAVSKKWYTYARPILLSTLRLSSEDLQPLLLATEGSTTLAAVQRATKHIDLVLAGRNSHYAAIGDFLLTDQTSLEKLAHNLVDFAALRSLIISTRGHSTIMPGRLLSSFASLNQLTSLKVDLAPFLFERAPTHHVCESISQLLPNLEILHCRLPHMCEDLLKSPPGALKELIINISCETDGSYSIYDSDHFPSGADKLRTSLKTCLLQFAASMRDPKIVRLIYNFWRLHAFDAIENRRLLFGDSTAWDADCLLLPEDWNTDDEIDNDDDRRCFVVGKRGSDEEDFYFPGEDSDQYTGCGIADGITDGWTDGYTDGEERDDEEGHDEHCDENSRDEASDEE